MTVSARPTGPANDPPPGTAADPPAWIPWADLLVVVLTALAAAVAITGGLRERLPGGTLVSLRSPWRLVAAALVVLALRHAWVPRPPLHARAADGLRRVWAAVAAHVWLGLHVLAVLALLASVLREYRPETGLTALIQFGSEFDAQALPEVRQAPHYVHPGSWGYDGQFYAQLAVAPGLRHPGLADAIDAPSYRGRRILFAWTAYVGGLGQPARILQAYAWQNVVAWLVLAGLLLQWCPMGSARHFAAWFACLFTTGAIASVRLALTDGPSMLLIAAAVLATERGRSGLALALAAVSGLGRETNVLAAAVLPPPADVRGPAVARYAARGALVLLPLLAWLAYVRVMLGGADTGIETLAWPLHGYLEKWTTTVGELRRLGWWSDARFSLFVLVSLTVQAGYLACRWRLWRQHPWWRVGTAYAGLMAVAGVSVWDGHPGAITRVVLPMTVAFNLLILRERRFWPLVVLGNLPVAVEVWYL